MPSDYEAISKHNERQLGLDTASRKTQISMYSDSTHFVYEILQNADDHGATEVLFRLEEDQVVIEHNGEPFTEENVKAITYFGKSTSREELVKAGRFGVGFKSVFMFTATPIIFSGDEHFRIHGLYRVSEHPYPSDLLRPRTRIILPFNHETEKPDFVEDLVSAETAFDRIATRLPDLNIHSLLFTQNIREIRWEVGNQSGHYYREDAWKGGARITTITDGENLNRYLVFSRTPTWRGDDHKDVEIAFPLEDDGGIARVESPLFVLFSTTQETGMGFILNGPYRTNPSRENISHDDAFNRFLLKETCVLLKDSLLEIRDRGLLTPQFLGVLPNPTDELKAFYSALHDAAIEAFQESALVPTDDGGFSPSTAIFRGPASIREVFDAHEIAELTGVDSAKWAMGVTPNSRPDQFLDGLEAREWSWQHLQAFLTKNFHYWISGHREWLGTRTDTWLQRLYMLLGDGIQRKDLSQWSLKSCTIIRVREDGEIQHARGDRCFFPKGRGYRDLPQVKRSILKGKTQSQAARIEESLRLLGVKDIGKEERIDLILETYYEGEGRMPSNEQHLSHMKLFINWWKEGGLADRFHGEEIFRVQGSKGLRAGESCYLDKPLKSTGLKTLFGAKIKGVTKRHCLWGGYRELRNIGLVEFATACGVWDTLPIERRSGWEHPNRQRMKRGLWNTRKTHTGIDRDFHIPDLAHILAARNSHINALVWRTMAGAKAEILEAKYRPNQQYPIRREPSSVVLLLSQTDWIPDRHGTLKKPTEISKEDLHPSFRYSNKNGWLDAIGFGLEAKRADERYQENKKKANDLGIPMDLIEHLQEFPAEERPEVMSEMVELLRKKANAKKQEAEKAAQILPFHEVLSSAFDGSGSVAGTQGGNGKRISRNPGRRRTKLSEQIAEGMENQGSDGDRFSFTVKKRWKAKNDLVRTKLLEWYGGRCQICDRTFSQINGSPYFEGVYLVSHTHAEWIDRPGNVLCLCPWHSAMLQFGPREFEGDVLKWILSFLPEKEGGDGSPTLPLILCGEKTKIQFAEDHLLELQVMIQESQKAAPRD